MDKFFMIKGSTWTPFLILMTVILTRMGFHTPVAGLEFIVIPALALLLMFLPGIVQYAFVWGYAVGGFASMSGWALEGYLIGIILGSGILCVAGGFKCKEILFDPKDLDANSLNHAKDTIGIFKMAPLVIPLAAWAAVGGWYLDLEFTYKMTVGIAAVYLLAVMWIGMSFLSDIYEFSTGELKEYVENDDCPYY